MVRQANKRTVTKHNNASSNFRKQNKKTASYDAVFILLEIT